MTIGVVVRCGLGNGQTFFGLLLGGYYFLWAGGLKPKDASHESAILKQKVSRVMENDSR